MAAKTYAEIAEIISGFGLPCAYYQFEDDTQQSPPFICWFYGYDPMYADDSNYVEINQLFIELYTRRKDINLETSIEKQLKSAGFTYSKEAEFINAEKMWQISYTMEVLIDGN